mgnify:CR=1 FL=1
MNKWHFRTKSITAYLLMSTKRHLPSRKSPKDYTCFRQKLFSMKYKFNFPTFIYMFYNVMYQNYIIFIHILFRTKIKKIRINKPPIKT